MLKEIEREIINEVLYTKDGNFKDILDINYKLAQIGMSDSKRETIIEKIKSIKNDRR